MPAIEHVLVNIPFNERQFDILSSALAPARVTVITDKNCRTIGNVIDSIDVAFLRGQINGSLLNAPALKWIHCNAAGLERSATRELFERGIILTSSAGRSAPALAEHALMFMMALNFGYPRLYVAQCRKDWRNAKSIARRNTPLCECTLGIVGTGHTGTALAGRAKSLGLRVEGYRRRSTEPPPGFDRIYSKEAGDPLDRLLQAADFLVLAVPLNDQTVGLMGRREFSMMKPRSVIVNIARGSLIDEAALIDALDRGKIAGAGLDTFGSEPLPKNSPLWSHPNVLITPHARPTLSDREDRVLQQLTENIELYRYGSRLNNQLNEDDIFTGTSVRSKASVVASKSAGGARVTRAVPPPVRRMLRRIRKALKAQRNRRTYPLRPIRRIRKDVRRYHIDTRAYIEVYWKMVEQSVVPSMSLFVEEHEVVRFDCLGPGAGHYHVADNSGFHRIKMSEQEKEAQIDRGFFEIKENLAYFLKQNPRSAIRQVELNAEGVARACAEARPALMAYVAKSDSRQSASLDTELPVHEGS